MSEVKRFTEGPIGRGIYVDPEGELCGFHHLERVTAERDALQKRLTAVDERVDVLEGLLRTSLVAMTRIYSAGREFIVGSGSDCDSVALMMENDPTAREIRAALKPAEVTRNQCDGCQAGIPVVNGAHRMGKPGGYPDTMSCTAKLYKPAEGAHDFRMIGTEKMPPMEYDEP